MIVPRFKIRTLRLKSEEVLVWMHKVLSTEDKISSHICSSKAAKACWMTPGQRRNRKRLHTLCHSKLTSLTHSGTLLSPSSIRIFCAVLLPYFTHHRASCQKNHRAQKSSAAASAS